MTIVDTIVIGSGPVGLALACGAAQLGLSVKLFEKRAEPSTRTKAIVLWSGAQEYLKQLGIPLESLNGVPLTGAEYLTPGGRRIARIEFARLKREGMPLPLSVPQPDVEEALRSCLQRVGGSVSFGACLDSYRQDADGVEAFLSSGGPSVRSRWLVGCDGVGSLVRRLMDVRYSGASFEDDYVLADGVIEGEIPIESVRYHVSGQGVVVVVPLPGNQHRVFIQLRGDHKEIDLGDCNRFLDERGLDIRILKADSVSRFKIQQRVADRYVDGRVVLAGDAAHAHSPAGGQGMNTGILDAANLAWRIGDAVRKGDRTLVDGYEAERRPVAVGSVRSSAMQARMWSIRTAPGRIVRDGTMRALWRSGYLERRVVPDLASTTTYYRSTVGLARAAVDGLRPGRLIPWSIRVETNDGGRKPLRQVLCERGYRWSRVVLHTDPDRSRAAARASAGEADLHVIRVDAGRGAGSLRIDVRPDGYLAGVTRVEAGRVFGSLG